MTAADHADEQMAGEQGTGRRRPRDRGFQRPGGPALVARPEPLAAVPAPPATAPEPAAPDPASPEPAAAETEEAPDRGAASTAAAATKPSAPARGRGTNLPMPPARHTELRVQFNTKLRPASIARTKAFADHHQASIQDVVELALDEFLSRRGWPEADS